MTDPAAAPGGRRLEVRVYYEDTDFTGVVYHAAHVRFFERGRTEFLRALGVGHRQLIEGPEACAFVVTRLEVDYRLAARIDDLLSVETRLAAMRGPRLTFVQTLLRGEALIAQARVEAACITPAGAARRPPAAVIAAGRRLLEGGGA